MKKKQLIKDLYFCYQQLAHNAKLAGKHNTAENYDRESKKYGELHRELTEKKAKKILSKAKEPKAKVKAEFEAVKEQARARIEVYDGLINLTIPKEIYDKHYKTGAYVDPTEKIIDAHQNKEVKESLENSIGWDSAKEEKKNKTELEEIIHLLQCKDIDNACQAKGMYIKFLNYSERDKTIKELFYKIYPRNTEFWEEIQKEHEAEIEAAERKAFEAGWKAYYENNSCDYLKLFNDYKNTQNPNKSE